MRVTPNRGKSAQRRTLARSRDQLRHEWEVGDAPIGGSGASMRERRERAPARVSFGPSRASEGEAGRVGPMSYKPKWEREARAKGEMREREEGWAFGPKIERESFSFYFFSFLNPIIKSIFKLSLK